MQFLSLMLAQSMKLCTGVLLLSSTSSMLMCMFLFFWELYKC